MRQAFSRGPFDAAQGRFAKPLRRQEKGRDGIQSNCPQRGFRGHYPYGTPLRLCTSTVLGAALDERQGSSRQRDLSSYELGYSALHLLLGDRPLKPDALRSVKSRCRINHLAPWGHRAAGESETGSTGRRFP